MTALLSPFTTVDRWHNEILCRPLAWDHVMEGHFTTLATREQWVEETVRDPLAVYRDGKHPTRRVYFRHYYIPDSDWQNYAFLRVIVEYFDERAEPRNPGLVWTAFLCGRKAGDEWLWGHRMP